MTKAKQLNEETVVDMFFDGGKFKDCILSDFAEYNGRHVAFVEMTPELATFWLAMNKDNVRGLRKHRVQKYRNSAEKNGWDENCETIKFSNAAKLVDGQHRVKAVAESQRSIVVLVAFGVRDILHIDTGMPRSLRDNLTRLGFDNARDLVGATKRIFSFMHTGSVRNDGYVTLSDHADVVKFLKAHEDIKESLPHGRRIAAYLGKNIGAALHYIFTNSAVDGASGGESAAYFFDVLSGDRNPRKDCPVGGLKKQLDADNGRSRHRIRATERLAMAIKAWNMLVDNEAAKRLSWSQAKEDFPFPRGWEDAFEEVIEDDSAVDAEEAAAT